VTCFATYFAEGVDITSANKIAEICRRVGLHSDEALAAITSLEIKDRLKREVEESLCAGVFGSPFFIVDGEPFWGGDSLDQVAARLETGGF